MLFPVCFLEEGQKVENLQFSAGVSYVVAQDGIYKRVKTDLFEYTVKINNGENVDGLAKTMAPSANVFTKIIPRELLRQIEAFFRKAYEMFQGEAIVLLYFNPKKKDWMVRVPPQKVQGLHVKYDALEAPGEIDGYYLASSIHSHAAAAAFHSGTDDHDELEFDGLHITIGNVNKSVRSYAARWMLGRTVFEAKLDEVLGLELEALPDVPDAWISQVTKDEPVVVIRPDFTRSDLGRPRSGLDVWSNTYAGWETVEGPIGMNDMPSGGIGNSDEVYTERDVVADPFALVYDFEALLEDYS